jgi:hypothetical protein
MPLSKGRAKQKVKAPTVGFVSEMEVIKERAATSRALAEVDRLRAILASADAVKMQHQDVATGELRAEVAALSAALEDKTADGLKVVAGWLSEYTREAKKARAALVTRNEALQGEVDRLRVQVGRIEDDADEIATLHKHVANLEVRGKEQEAALESMKRTGWMPEWCMGLYEQWRAATTEKDRIRFGNRLVQRCLSLATSQRRAEGGTKAGDECAVVIRGFNDVQAKQVEDIVSHLRAGGGVTLNPPKVVEPAAVEAPVAEAVAESAAAE